MTRSQLFLLLLISLTVMFIGLLTLGAYYWSLNHMAVAVICLVLGFISALGQFAALALFLRERTRVQWLRQQQTNASDSSLDTIHD